MNKRLLCAGCLTFWGVLLFIGGWVANYAILKTVANTLNSGVKTSTDTSSDSYLNFVDSSRPDVAITYWDYYLFNTTNYNDVSLNGALPILKEVGPYSFIETAKKYPSTTTEDGSATATPGLTFNADKSEASWISWSTFKFNAATSGAGLTEDDIVITPSPLTNALQNANEGLEENFFPYVTPFLFALYSIIRPTPWTPAFPPSLATTASFISEVGMYMAWGTTMNYTLDHPDAPRPNITTYLATRNAVAASAAAGNIELSKPGKNVNLPSDYYNFLRYCKLATPGDILGNYYAGVTTPFCDYTQDQPGFDAAIWPTYGISNETMSNILFQGHYPLWYGLTATKQGVCYLDADETQICAASLFQPTAKNVYALGGPNTEYNLTSNQITGLQLFSMAWSFALHQHALDRAGYHIHPVTVTDDPSPTAGTYTTPRGARRWRILSATKTVRGGEQDKVAQVLNPLGYRGVGLFSNYPSLKQAMKADEYQTINTGQVDFSLNDRIKQTQKLENIKWCNSKQVNVFSSGAKFTPQMPPGKQEGLKFVPTLTKDSIVPLWSDEIGRSVEMAFDKESSVKGVSTYRFKIASYMLTPNATRNDGTTFTNRELFGVTLEGVADMSCYSSLKTAHASQPRFYGTPESQRTKYAGLSGMQAPDPNVYVNLEMEPNTGAAIAGRLALQTSLRIDLKSPYYCLNSTSLGEPAFYYCKHNFQGWPTSTNIGSINPGFADDLSNNKPFYMHPIMYVLKHSELTDKQADTLKSSLLRAIDASLIILVVLTIVGGVLAITGLILLIQTRSAGKTSGGDGMRLD